MADGEPSRCEKPVIRSASDSVTREGVTRLYFRPGVARAAASGPEVLQPASMGVSRRALLGALSASAVFAVAGLLRPQPSSGASAMGPDLALRDVPLTIDPGLADRLTARLKARGLALADSDDGLIEVPLQSLDAPLLDGQMKPLLARSGKPLAEPLLSARSAQTAAEQSSPVQLAAVKPAAVRGEPAAAKPAQRLTARPPRSLPPTSGPVQIAIVIDDLGLSHARTHTAIDLPVPVTLAFLPYADGLPVLTERAAARGHELLAHVPMQPRASRVPPGPNALTMDMDADALRAALDWNLARFSGFRGINNHMGSALTSSAWHMETVLAVLDERALFFLDSRTTGASAARDAAAQLSLPYAERDVFLDNHQDAHYIALQIAHLEDEARRYGNAIAIGHPHAATLKALAAWLPDARNRGFEIVPVEQIVAARQSPFWRLARVPRAGLASG